MAIYAFAVMMLGLRSASNVLSTGCQITGLVMLITFYALLIANFVYGSVLAVVAGKHTLKMISARRTSLLKRRNQLLLEKEAVLKADVTTKDYK